jgi:hypothetical protein
MSRLSHGTASLENVEALFPSPVIAAPLGVPESANRCKGEDRTVRAAGTPRTVQVRKLSTILAMAILFMASAAARGQSVFATPQSVFTTSAAQDVTVMAQAAGTVNQVEVLTLGVSGLEFSKGSGALACESAVLTSGATCQESVAFTPAYPGRRAGAVVLLDGNSNVLGTAYLSGTGVGGLGVFFPGNVITVAGVYRNWTSTQDDVPATDANLEQPSSIAFDGAGNMYIADSGPTHNEVRMVCAGANSATITGTTCPGAGIIMRIAGTGGPGYSGDGGPASNSTLNAPSGLALDGAGNLYIADTGNNVIRKITAATGLINTVAGNGTAGYAGDGRLATSAELSSPEGVTVDSGGSLYIADTANQRIRRVVAPVPPAVAGIITTVAGNGEPSGNGDGKGTYSGDGQPATVAGLSLPYAVAFDASGNMYIPDSANNRIRMVNAAGTISTAVGTGDAGDSCANWLGSEVALNTPSGVAVDAAGNLYIADTQDSCIQEASATTGTVTAIAVNGETAVSSNGTLGLLQVYAPLGLTLDGSGNLYFADFYNMLVGEIQRNRAVLSFIATPVRQGSFSTPQNQTLQNNGNAALDLSAITPDQNSAVNDSSLKDACATGVPLLAVDASCQIGAVFAPSESLVFPTGVTSEQIFANIDIGKPGDTANSPLDIELIGQAAIVNSTTVTVASSNNPSHFGQIVTFTATVTTGAGTGNLTGTVSFLDGTTTLAAGIVLKAPAGTTGTATFTTTVLNVGLHPITAVYNNTDDANHFSSTSAPLAQTVVENTATGLTSSVDPSAVGQNVTFTATVTIAGGGGVIPDGTVTFSDGGTALQTVAINSNGVATYSTAALAQGLNAITAIYNGDSPEQIQASTSNVVSQDVQASSSTVVASIPNPSSFGTAVTFTATVTPNASAPATGVVNFLDGGSLIGTSALAGSTNQATYTTAMLAAGTHSITAAYQGSPNYAASTSPAIMQSVNTTTPTIAWATPAAITYGTALSALQLDASSGGVAGTFAYTPPAGTVLAAGTQSLAVNFTPNDSADYNGASATVQLTVNKASPTMTLTTSGTPSSFGAAIMFTATVSSGPAGTVTFYDGGNPIGSAALNGTTATLTIATLTLGAHTITASWAGTSNYNAVTSSPITQTVSMATPVITWSTPVPIVYGTALSATQLDASTTVSGTFTYSPALGTVLGAGTRTLSVAFTPTDATDYNTAMATVPLKVNQATPTITWAAPAAINYGTALSAAQLNASADGVAGTFVYTPAAGTVLSAGTQTLSVTFVPADAADYSSPAATVQLTVNKASPTMTVSSSGTPSSYGAAVTFTAAVSSGPTGPVTFFDGTNPLGTGTLNGTTAAITTSTLALGAHSITASWAGNNNYNPVTSNPITQMVIPTQTSTTITAAPSPGIAGLASVITATVTLTAGQATPTGTVLFTDSFNSTATTLGSAPVGAVGTAAIHPNLAPGNHSIVATYSGDADDSTSVSAPFALTVNQATTAATLTTTPNPALVLAPITFTAMVTSNGGSPTGSVGFYANGITLLGTGTLEPGGTATFTYSGLAAGSYQMTAVYAGDTNNAGAASGAVTQVIGVIPTATALGVSSTAGTTPAAILVATVMGTTGPAPTGTVTFSSGSTTLGSATLDASGVATLNPNLTSGVSYTVSAAYGGDALHGPSASAAISVSGTPTDYTITVNPSKLSLAQSQNATLTVTLNSNSGFSDTIGLGCGSLPAGVTCHFSSLNLPLTANGTQTAQLTIDTNNPLGGGSSAMFAHPGGRGVSLAGLLFPLSVLFGWVLRRFRRRFTLACNATLALLLCAATLAVTGCSGITQITAAPGTYVIEVFGAGVNSNISTYQSVTLTITK